MSSALFSFSSGALSDFHLKPNLPSASCNATSCVSSILQEWALTMQSCVAYHTDKIETLMWRELDAGPRRNHRCLSELAQSQRAKSHGQTSATRPRVARCK